MDEQRQDETKADVKGNLKRIFGPPAIVLSCWIIFMYGGISQFLNPKWDYVTGLTFGTLAFGFLVLPFVVLSLAITWWHAPSGKKGLAVSYFVGWAFAWVILVIGFIIIPYSKGWP